MAQKENLKKTCIVLFCFFSLLGVIVIILRIFLKDVNLGTPIEWFVLALFVFIFPYLNEFSIFGVSGKLQKELEQTNNLISEYIMARRNESRKYLIQVFSEYMDLLEKIEKTDNKYDDIKVKKALDYKIDLNKIYLEEMKVGIQWLKEVLGIKSTSDNVDEELVEKLEKFQKDNKMIADGVFGNYTFSKMKERGLM